jgi:hypothetical protein
MLVDELAHPFPPQQQGESVEPGDHAGELDALDQENGHRGPVPAQAVEKVVLQAQGLGRHFLRSFLYR